MCTHNKPVFFVLSYILLTLNYISLFHLIGSIISSTVTFFSYEIDLNRFFEGSHTVITTVTDAGGNSDQETIAFTVEPPLGK